MGQLLIIDVQNSYKKHMRNNLVDDIVEYSKNFNNINYLWDNQVDGDLYSEIPDSILEDEDYYGNLNIIEKEYGFFRSIMDLGVDEDDEELVRLIKFMSNNNVGDVREIEENDELNEKFKEQFKNSPLLEVDFDSYVVSLPYDLIEHLSHLKNGVVLVGGGRNECLKEISILLRALDIKFQINEELTY